MCRKFSTILCRPLADDKWETEQMSSLVKLDQETRVLSNKELSGMMEPGDLLCFQYTGIAYTTHFAIVASVQTSGKITVIHKYGTNHQTQGCPWDENDKIGSDEDTDTSTNNQIADKEPPSLSKKLNKAEIREDDLFNAMDRLDLKMIAISKCSVQGCKERTLTVARSFLNQKGYNVFFDNCEHFAMHCFAGYQGSVQIMTIGAKCIAGIISFTIVSLIYNFGAPWVAAVFLLISIGLISFKRLHGLEGILFSLIDVVRRWGYKVRGYLTYRQALQIMNDLAHGNLSSWPVVKLEAITKDVIEMEEHMENLARGKLESNLRVQLLTFILSWRRCELPCTQSEVKLNSLDIYCQRLHQLCEMLNDTPNFQIYDMNMSIAVLILDRISLLVEPLMSSLQEISSHAATQGRKHDDVYTISKKEFMTLFSPNPAHVWILVFKLYYWQLCGSNTVTNSTIRTVMENRYEELNKHVNWEVFFSLPIWNNPQLLKQAFEISAEETIELFDKVLEKLQVQSQSSL